MGDVSQLEKEVRDANNSYEATFGNDGSKKNLGAKANWALKNKAGKDFKAEKNKKKRSTYMHGKIDSGAINSIPFDD